MSTPPPNRSIALAFLWMVGAVTCFTTVALSARGLSPQLTVFEMLALRNIGGIVILFAVIPLVREGVQIHPFRFDIHLLRNIVHFGGQASWVYALLHLPLAFVFALEFTTPAWTTLFATTFLREKLTMARVIAIVLGFIGVLVIVRPGLEPVGLATLMGLFSAVCFGVQITATKHLTATNTTWCILFWMNLMQLPMNLIANVVIGEPLWFASKITADMLWPLIGICTCGLGAHYCLTNAFRHGDAVMVAPMDFMRVPGSALAGWLLFGERFNPYVLLGAAIIMAGIVYSLSAERRRLAAGR